MIGNKRHISTQDSTTYLYKVLRILGLDNLNRSWLYNLHSFQLIFATCVLQLIGFTTSYIETIWTMSISTLLTSLQVTINIYLLAIKVIVLYFYMPELRKTEPILDELDKRIFEKEELAVARRMIKFCNSLIVVYTTSYLTYSAIIFTTSLLNLHPPFGIYIPFCHWEDSTLKLFLATLVEFYLFNVSCIQDVALDVYPITFIYMARMHTKILCLRVKKLGTDPTLSNEDNLERLVDCIETHKKILEFIQIVRPVISKALFLQFVVSAVVLGIPIINIMMFAESLSSSVSSFIFFSAVSLETLPMCFTMNVFMDEINNLPTAIFHSAWVDRNKTFRQMMLFFMQNAQQFKILVAGNMLPINVATFLSIVKLSFSIYAVVDKIADRRAAQATLKIE